MGRGELASAMMMLRQFNNVYVASHGPLELFADTHGQIEKVAEFCGLTLNKVPRVKDIEHEVDAKS